MDLFLFGQGSGVTCLMRAAQMNNMALAHIFAVPHEARYLVHRIDAVSCYRDVRDDLLLQSGRSGLFYAVRSSAYSSMKALLESGVRVNSQDIFGDTPLHWAIRHDDKVAAKILLDAGADVGIANNVSDVKAEMFLSFRS